MLREEDFMNLDQIKYIVKIAETGSISTAAKQLHVSQPNVSQAILSLEKEMNIKIFRRSRLGANPTDVGKVFIEKCKIILKHVNDLNKIAQVESNILRGSLMVIAIPIIGLTFLPKALGIYKNHFPEVQIEVFEDGSKHGIECVVKGTADLGIITLRSNLPSDPRVTFEPLITSRTIAYVGKHSPLARKKVISLEEIIEHPIVLFNERYSSNNFMREALEEYGKPNILFTSGNSDAMRKVIAESLAIGFYSDISLKMDPYILNKHIVPIRIKEEEDVYSTYGVITKKNSPQNIIVKKFIEELKIQAELFKRMHNLPDYSK